MKDFKSLLVWKKAHELVKTVYYETKSYPKEELYGITSQLRRAAVSIPTNIAEGCGKHTEKEFAGYLQISMGSACEAEYLMLLSLELGYLLKPKYSEMEKTIVEIKKMLVSLLKNIREK